jgi:NAD(P)-dependent dehydrogenase (short-subunit alcohol dehydrogenase family)
MNRTVVPHMRRQGSGLVIYISSGAGLVVLPGHGFHCASKFALEAFAEAYSYELASQCIDSAIVESGAFATAIFEKGEEAVDTVRTSSCGPASEIPQRLFAQLTSSPADPQEVADCVVSLIERPAGNRPLRLTVGLRVDAFGGLNYFSERLQQEVLHAIGVAPLTAF